MRKLVLIAITILLVGASVVMAADVPTTSGPGGPGRGVRPEAVNAILWDQLLSATNTNAYVDQDFTDIPTYSSYLADDFVVPAGGWQISAIFVPGDGWNGFTTIFNATMLHFEIYADAAGLPAGYRAAGRRCGRSRPRRPTRSSRSPPGPVGTRPTYWSRRPSSPP